MNNYKIIKSDNIEKGNVEFLRQWPWNYDYEPDVSFSLTYSDDRFYVRLRAYETDPVAVITKRNGPTCNDSCIEFFFCPVLGDNDHYINFEVNANPTFLFNFNTKSEHKEIMIDCPEEILNIRREKNDEFWQVDFELPFELIRKYSPDFSPERDKCMRANVYKCGVTDQPAHFGCWNRVQTPGPNFHLPMFFGMFLFE